MTQRVFLPMTSLRRTTPRMAEDLPANMGPRKRSRDILERGEGSAGPAGTHNFAIVAFNKNSEDASPL